MPIYEYRCPSCGDTFEQRRPMSQATDPAPCPSCKTESPRTVSRLARVSRLGGDEGGGDDGGLGESDFSGGHSHDHGLGHSH